MNQGPGSPSQQRPPQRVVLAVTGASGSLYAVRFLRRAVAHGLVVDVILSDASREVLAAETDLEATMESLLPGADPGVVTFHSIRRIGASIASGSYRTRGMAVVPCSMGTLARIASGTSSNLIERAADVHLKERRALVLVPRETPLSLIHLENMTKATRAGATILPASPGFYGRPKDIDALVDFVVDRIFQALGIDIDPTVVWTGEKPK